MGLEPLTDAVARGSVATGGRCVEVGSGTGIATPALAVAFAAEAGWGEWLVARRASREASDSPSS